MDPAMRPWRSVLHIPGSRPRALEKARTLPCDGIIFDLEDAVAVEEKAAARAALAGWLVSADYGQRAQIVRISALETAWGAADCAAFAGLALEAVLIPKVNGLEDVEAVAARVPGVPLWAMMETPLLMLNAAAIAAHPRLPGMVMGTNDLAKDIGARFRADRLPLVTGLGLCLLAAKANGLTIIDGVYNAFRDAEGLAAACAQGRDMGFDGKSPIHPDQIAVANAALAPTAAEIDLAARQIAAFEAAVAAGQGVAVVDGRIVENLHVAAARTTLARAAAIAALEAA
jgi:(3S)-malyl-CoA thioesterase